MNKLTPVGEAFYGQAEKAHETESVGDEDLDKEGALLHTPWTFWIDKSIRGTSAAECAASLKKLPTVKTVQAFWRVNNNLPKPSMMNPRYSYHLMRNESRPIWEDECNCSGGYWRMKCTKQNTDEAWQELQLAVVGEQFADFVAQGDDIIGLSVSIREWDDIIQIWNQNSSLSDQSSAILKKVNQLLPDVNFIMTFYKAFDTHEAFEGRKK